MKELILNCVLPFSSTVPLSLEAKEIEVIPASDKVISVPSPFKILIELNISSPELITPSLLESRLARASKPDEAFDPSALVKLSPKTSLPLLIIPSLFLSKTKMPSSLLTQAVFSAKLLLSWSK